MTGSNTLLGKYMKLLSVFNAYFELPEDFKGDYSDALRLLADYLEAPSPYLMDQCKISETASPWEAFEEVRHVGGKVSGTFGLKYYDGHDWADIYRESRK